MKNKNKAVWGSRFIGQTSKIFEEVGASIDVDKRLFEEDIFGSIVHTQMLMKQKIINKKNENRIINGLKKIGNEIRKNKFSFKFYSINVLSWIITVYQIWIFII